MLSKIKQVISEFQYRRSIDPVHSCELYKKEGCSHVDGFLCVFETCSCRLKYDEGNSMKLTRNQTKVLEELKSGKTIYVFPMFEGNCSYGYNKECTANRLYLTLTCRSLLKKDLVMHGLSESRMVLCLKNLNN